VDRCEEHPWGSQIVIERCSGLLISDRQSFEDRIVLPVSPIWPGFAINTIFYAAILWLLCVAPFALRRRIRARRGLCPACAYPIGTSDVCTECGKTVTRQLAMGNRQ